MTHQATSFVVVQVHGVAEVTSAFCGVDEGAGELDAEADVVGASAPLPVDSAGPPVVAVVAAARLALAVGAGSGHGVRYASGSECVEERGLRASYK